jgi:Domain of unknown function (DUF6983)
MQSLPLSANQNQTFTTTLSVDGNNLTLAFWIRWNTIAGYWIMTISDQNGNVLLDSIPLLIAIDNSGNLLGQYAYLKIGSAYLVKTGDTAGEYPTADNLSTEYSVVWGDTP